MATRNPELDREDRLNVILLDYVEAVERRESPSRDRILETRPEYAAQLRDFFMTRDRLDGIAAPLRVAIGGS